MPTPLDPGAKFRSASNTPLADATILDFWRWGFSDILNNTKRGTLAEFIVATALGSEAPTTDVWAPFDVSAPWGAKVEVKASAYVQGWQQRRPSRISWSITKSIPWSDELGEWIGDTPIRSADVYVFCLLHERDRERVDPLDLSQWSFYVVPTLVIDAQLGDARTVGIAAIERLTQHVPIHELRSAVRAANSNARG